MSYITVQGDTWDQIALKSYGSELATRDIMAANGTENPEILTVWRFPYGEALKTPELTEDTTTLAQLPVWRRE